MNMVVLSIGDDEIEVGTIEEVVSLLGPDCHEIAMVAYRIAGFIASVAESVALDPDMETAEITLEIR